MGQIGRNNLIGHMGHGSSCVATHDPRALLKGLMSFLFVIDCSKPHLCRCYFLSGFRQHPKPDESRAVTGKPRDATVNFDRYGECRQLRFFDAIRCS